LILGGFTVASERPLGSGAHDDLERGERRRGKEEDQMDGMDAQRKPPRRRWLAPIGLVIGGMLAGGIFAGTQIASAQDSSTSAASATAPGGDPVTMKHGPDETLLTSDTADKVEAAALDAVPGATVIRVETDSDGSAYEAHLQKDDGSVVTVKVDKDFNVTDTESGFGAGPGLAPSGMSEA
jgi:hypothetical protein